MEVFLEILEIFREIGNTHLYKPQVSKDEYTRFQFSSLLKNYFGGSFPKMATFFARENKLTIKELEEMLKTAKDELKKDKPKSK